MCAFGQPRFVTSASRIHGWGSTNSTTVVDSGETVLPIAFGNVVESESPNPDVVTTGVRFATSKTMRSLLPGSHGPELIDCTDRV